MKLLKKSKERETGIIIPLKILRDEELAWSTKILYGIVATHGGLSEEGFTQPNSFLCKLMHDMHHQVITKKLTQLVNYGYLTRDMDPGGKNRCLRVNINHKNTETALPKSS